MQVPIAVLLDLLFRHPAWLQRAVPAVLTISGGVLILAGFFGINLSASQEAEQVWRAAWEGDAFMGGAGLACAAGSLICAMALWGVNPSPAFWAAWLAAGGGRGAARGG